MTFSIIARDPIGGTIGVAIASRFFAVGAICPFIFPGVGAVVTQAAGHPPFGPRGGVLLRDGLSAQATIEQLLADDPQRQSRQLHVLDSHGGWAGFTGAECIAAAGYRQGPGMSVAGNMLASEDVLDAAVAAFDPRLPLAERLLVALDAAHRAGGDKRGQQAAALLIYGAQDFPLLSLRIDDDAEAVGRLRALYGAAATDYIPFMGGKAQGGEAEAVFGA